MAEQGMKDGQRPEAAGSDCRQQQAASVKQLMFCGTHGCMQAGSLFASTSLKCMCGRFVWKLSHNLAAVAWHISTDWPAALLLHWFQRCCCHR
jgi:hypothetical protein